MTPENKETWVILIVTVMIAAVVIVIFFILIPPIYSEPTPQPLEIL